MKQVFLAGAHADDLSELVAEIRELEDILRPLYQREVCGVLSIREANLKDIVGVFSRQGEEISVFHYAGHANQRELHLEGGGKARGLAELFGMTMTGTPHLVFLNGCASAGLVDNLQKVGCAAVIATSREINDRMAREFASCFYETWKITGKGLEQAFQTAAANIHSKPEGETLAIVQETRGFGRAGEEQLEEAIPWGLYLNPQLSEEERREVLTWAINPPVELSPLVLEKVETVTSESLRKIVYEFCATDPVAQKLVRENNYSELMALIACLPWTVGSHLRRLFAVDKDKTMMQSSEPRLLEIVRAYTELTRFICYVAFSALWEELLNQPIKIKSQISKTIPDILSDSTPDYVYYLKKYHQLLYQTKGDPIHIVEKIGGFLAEVNGRLLTAYQFMESLKNILTHTEKKELLNNFITYNGPNDGVGEVCRKAEAAYAQLIKAALFLTEYKLYSVRAISVDKVRYLNMEDPFVHKTITLHAAFGEEPSPKPTKRKIAGDNYSILLAPRAPEGADPLENALNLSPFYIDKHALIAEKRDNYPAIFVLKNHATEKQEFEPEEDMYTFEYLDLDINHTYLAPEDYRLAIAHYGLKPNTNLKEKDEQRFREIYLQIEKLSQDFQSVL